MSTVTVLDDYLAGLMEPRAAKPAAEPRPLPPAPAESAVVAPPVAEQAPPAPLAPVGGGKDEIGDDEFEALLDALHGKGGAPTGPAMPAEPAPAVAVESAPSPRVEPAVAAPTPAPAPAPTPRDVPAGLSPDSGKAASPFTLAATPASHPDEAEHRRRAADRVTAWLRFGLADQFFAVEVLKVQEVLRVPEILPLRGAAPAMLGMMNLRGQIVPVLDLAMRLGLPRQVPDETSRVVVLEEHGDTLGLLVRAVADVVSISDASVESLNGPLALEGSDVMCGIARRERSVTVLLDARRLLV